MTDKTPPTRADRWMDALKNHPIVALIVVLAAVLAGAASFVNSFSTFKAFFLPERQKLPTSLVVSIPNPPLAPLPAVAPPAPERPPAPVPATSPLINCLSDHVRVRVRVTEATLPQEMKLKYFKVNALITMGQSGNIQCESHRVLWRLQLLR